MDRRRLLAAAVAGVTSLAGCTDLPGGPDGDRTPSASGPDGGTATVAMRTNYFDPIGLYLEPGDSVEFVMKRGNHSATAYHEANALAEQTRIPTDAEPFDSGVVTETGATVEHTFEATGTYDYYCTPHKPMGMVGRVVVGEPGGPAEQSEIPDGSVPASETILQEGAVAYDEFTTENGTGD